MDGVVGCKKDCSESTPDVPLLDVCELTVCTEGRRRTSTLRCG